MTIFGIFYALLSTQKVNVARFARNVECDFWGDFQTLCVGLGNAFVSQRLLSFFQRIFDQDAEDNPLKRVLEELNINTWPQNNIEYKQVKILKKSSK